MWNLCTQFSLFLFIYLNPFSPAANKQFSEAVSTGILHVWATVSKKLMSKMVNETWKGQMEWLSERMADGMTESGRMMAMKPRICERSWMICMGAYIDMWVWCVRGGGGLSYQCLIVFVLNCNSTGLPVAPLRWPSVANGRGMGKMLPMMRAQRS